MATSITGIGLYIYQFDSFATSIYYVFPVVEIFVSSSAIQVSMLIVHVLVYLCTIYALKVDIKEALLPYISMLLIVYLFRGNNLEKEKGKLLNAQLLEANSKLLTYSKDIKELTIVKERTRIAQELHDSIGHALVALRLHNKKPSPLFREW